MVHRRRLTPGALRDRRASTSVVDGALDDLAYALLTITDRWLA